VRVCKKEYVAKRKKERNEREEVWPALTTRISETGSKERETVTGGRHDRKSYHLKEAKGGRGDKKRRGQPPPHLYS